MWTTICAMLQIFGTLLVRISSCLLVLRMPPVGQPKQMHARAIYTLMVSFVLISTASFFLLFFRCVPTEGAWDKSLHAHCIPFGTWDVIQKIDGGTSWLFFIDNDPERLLIADTVFEVVMNFLTASLPLIFLRHPPTCLKKKWGVITTALLAYGLVDPIIET